MTGLVQPHFSDELKLAIAEARLAGIHTSWIRTYMYMFDNKEPRSTDKEMENNVRYLISKHGAYLRGGFNSPYARDPDCDD